MSNFLQLHRLVTYQAPLSMEFSRKEYWNRLPFPTSGYLPNPRIEPPCPVLAVFLDSSIGKESACNEGDPGSVPGLGRSAGEGIGCPLQYSWASLVAQLVKNLPPMWET